MQQKVYVCLWGRRRYKRGDLEVAIRFQRQQKNVDVKKKIQFSKLTNLVHR